VQEGMLAELLLWFGGRWCCGTHARRWRSPAVRAALPCSTSASSVRWAEWSEWGGGRLGGSVVTLRSYAAWPSEAYAGVRTPCVQADRPWRTLKILNSVLKALRNRLKLHIKHLLCPKPARVSDR
jgi:hypothetical protein